MNRRGFLGSLVALPVAAFVAGPRAFFAGAPLSATSSEAIPPTMPIFVPTEAQQRFLDGGERILMTDTLNIVRAKLRRRHLGVVGSF